MLANVRESKAHLSDTFNLLLSERIIWLMAQSFSLLQVQLSAVTPPPTLAGVPSGLEDSLTGLSISTAAPCMPSELQTGTFTVCT